jgi:hypothetical protein
VPSLVETYGSLGKPAVAFPGMLGAEAMAGGDESKSGFVAAALPELSAAKNQGKQHKYSTQASVGTGQPGRKLAPLDLASTQADAR